MKIYIKKLGCPKNDVDADYIAGRLIDAGHEIVTDENSADTVIVNTCGFILPAKEESINEILYYEKAKQEGRIEKLIVTGCLSQRYGDDLIEEIPLADGIFGLGQHEALVDQLRKENSDHPILEYQKSGELKYLSYSNRFVDKKYPYDYLKIADGCDRFCSYCAIPSIRGRYRSRPIDDIVSEAKRLVECGKRELILVSQEGTGFGRDFSDGTNPVKLLSALESIDRLEWIRLMYLHPESLTDDLIDFMAHSDKVLSYFDMPLQHISDNMLKIMKRRVTRLDIENRLDKIREASKNSILRTTFISGHPGETEKDFEQLHDFIEQFEFDRLGVFDYSPEEGTSAYKMTDMIEDEIVSERQDLLMSLQQEIAFKKNITLIDSIKKVIIDEIAKDNLALARTKGDCPDIDQVVYVSGNNLKVGDIIDARITAAEGYDLIGRMEAMNESD